MKSFLFGIVFCSISKLFASPGDSIILSLEKRSIRGLDSSLVSLKRKSRNIEFYQSINRQIIDSFYEVIYFITESFPAGANPNVSSINEFRILLIRSGDKIIYCKMEDRSVLIRSPGIIKYKDKAAISMLTKAYINMYGRRVGIKSFFNDKIVYGSRCGYSGTPLKNWTKLNRYVQKKRLAKLRRWLRSPLAELQIYALNGFHQLYKAGYKLRDDERRIIDFVKSKKGDVNICVGCIYGSQKISEVTEEFVFD